MFVDRKHEETRHAFPHPPDLERLENIWPKMGWHVVPCSLYRDEEELASWNTIDSIHDNPQTEIEAYNGLWVVSWGLWTDGEHTALHTGPANNLYTAVAELKAKVEAFNQARNTTLRDRAT